MREELLKTSTKKHSEIVLPTWPEWEERYLSLASKTQIEKQFSCLDKKTGLFGNEATLADDVAKEELLSSVYTAAASKKGGKTKTTSLQRRKKWQK